jgi:SAM-dependent methyltransferase
MINHPTHDSSVFDEYSHDYDAALAQGLSASGEDKDYFARGRISWLKKCLLELGEESRSVMDFGCGTGSATRYLLDLPGVESLLGVDTSAQSLEVARRNFGSSQTAFALFGDYEPTEQLDMAFSNGVFHHIAPDERSMTVNYIQRSLRPGGLFAFWENNPWNPGTRYVMSRIPFDRDAITLTHREAKHLLQQGGFEILRTDFQFIFPRVLRSLRAIEPHLSRLPLGAQYQVLCRKW